MPDSKLRLVLADDNPSALQVFTSALSVSFDIVAAVPDGLSALHSICELHPDVAVLDLEMPGLNGIEVTRELRKRDCSLAVVICSIYRDQQLIQAAADVGATGYVVKIDGLSDLEAAIRTVAQGGRHFPSL